MIVQFWVCLLVLVYLCVDSVVDWVQLYKGEVFVYGCDMLVVLGLWYSWVMVYVCFDLNDLILLELQLLLLFGCCLQVVLQGEVEVMLLDDLQEVVLVYGVQVVDGMVLVVWFGQQVIVQVQQLLVLCVLQLQVLYLMLLLLFWQDGYVMLQVSGEYLLVCSGCDWGFV